MNFKTPLIIITILFIPLYVFLNWLDHPLPQYEGIKSLPIMDQVDVFTDPYGVPHVFANNEKDLFFTAGYIAARDRLFQLAMVSLAVRGELASVLGIDYLKTDIYLRTWRIHYTAKLLVKNMDPINRKIFENFCDGINYRIKEVKNNLPLEFKILGFKPQDWDPVIVAGYARMMAHEMQGSWRPEIIFGAVRDYFGDEKLKELLPNSVYDIPTIAKTYSKNKKIFFDEVIEQENVLRSIFGDPTADLGSNNWVVSGKKTNTGRPFLANDPHLAFTQPPRWYEIHLKGGRFNVSGVCIAGIPLPVIGQNEYAAWGFTNSMVDDLDFFVETLNPKQPSQYRHGEEWKNITEFEENFSVKDRKDTTIYIRETHHGPIISDIHPNLKNDERVISMSWTGHWITKELDAWVQLTTMKNWMDFSNGVKNFGVPGQNIVYADINGNIGWRPAVFVPIRREGFNMSLRPGENPDYDWKGKIPFGDMPYLYNPENGFISTANNRTIDEGFPYYISGLWADPSRAETISTFLSKNILFSIEDMKNLQLDYTSEYGRTIIRNLRNYNIELKDPGHTRAYKMLMEWDGVEGKESEGALLFHLFIKNFTENVFADEFNLLGSEYYKEYLSLKYIKDRKIRELIQKGNSSWIDNINTKNKIENIETIVKETVIDMATEIKSRYGANISNWKWGEAHTVTHKHMLSKVKILDYLFSLNIGPYISGGSSWTPNAGGYSSTNPFHQTSGASMRRIVDFDNLNETRMIIPTGQSGLHNSPHYRDQALLYHDGKYRVTYFDENHIRNDDSFRKLVMIPMK